MSTRRVDVDGREYRFDHGAQFMTVRDERLKEIITRPLELGVLKVWHSAIPHASYPEIKESLRFCGSTGMNALSKYFSSDLECRFNWKCVKVTFEKTHWKLFSSEGETIECKILVLATPLPQSLDLVAGLGMDLQVLRDVRYFPTWAVMFGALETFQLPFPHAPSCACLVPYFSYSLSQCINKNKIHKISSLINDNKVYNYQRNVLKTIINKFRSLAS